jgi:hypothetical protein
MRLLLAFTCAIVATAVSAREPPFRDGFDATFMASCEKAILERAVHDYAALAGMPVEKLPSGLRDKIRAIAQPVLASCSCLRDKTKTSFESESATEAEATIEIPLRSPECSPRTETSSSVNEKFQRLLQTTPALAESLRQSRSSFSINASAAGRLSLFASEQPPPQGFPRLVFLAPGTGSACPTRNLCVDKSPLESTSASQVLVQYAKVLGSAGTAALKSLMEKFGEDAKIITSGHNFTNFLPGQSSGQFSYPITQIDNQQIEQSRVKRLWLVIFNSPAPADSRSFEFIPALTTVVELEFSNGQQN